MHCGLIARKFEFYWNSNCLVAAIAEQFDLSSIGYDLVARHMPKTYACLRLLFKRVAEMGLSAASRLLVLGVVAAEAVGQEHVEADLLLADETVVRQPAIGQKVEHRA